MLVEAGAKVMLVDLNAEAVEAKARELGDNALRGGRTSATRRPPKRRCRRRSGLGGLHGLVNCAGIVAPRKSSARTARTPWPASPGHQRQPDRQLQPAAPGCGGHGRNQADDGGERG
jgi:NAD(P)-dependent dehydrogenase (short-subunit alcohol dehydrogenase family)